MTRWHTSRRRLWEAAVDLSVWLDRQRWAGDVGERVFVWALAHRNRYVHTAAPEDAAHERGML